MIPREIRILVVDDDPQMVKAIVRVLAQGGIYAESTMDPKEAMTIIENNQVDLLITDYLMPEINGLDLLHILKRQNTNAIGMLITGLNDFSLAVSAINEGSIVHFFTKPFKNAEMLNNVQNAIGAIGERRQLEALKAIRISSIEKADDSALYDLIHHNVIEGLTHLLKAKDEDLFFHSYRISKLCAQFGKHLGMDEEEINLLESSAILHDIGKLAIKDQILDKPSRLNEDEYTSMKRHPQVGSELLQKLGVHTRIVKAVLQHHEHVNGEGYPMGIRSNEMLIDAKIISIADAFDAMRSKRVYKQGYDFDTTRQIMMRLSGVIYDEKLLNQFFEFTKH